MVQAARQIPESLEREAWAWVDRVRWEREVELSDSGKGLAHLVVGGRVAPGEGGGAGVNP